jgi:hypothetical protein
MPTLLLLLALAAPAAPRAEATGGCHCFTQRTFDPGAPAAADPYVLATTRNSLLSAAFDLPKREIVRAEMGGTSPDDLWIAHWAAARAKVPADGLLDAARRKGSWKAALGDREALGDGVERLGPAFRAALARGAPARELAALAVDDVLASRARAEAAAVAALRAAGASSAETILATFAGRRLGAAPIELLAKVRGGSATWGSVLHGGGVAPAELDGLVRGEVR